MEPSSSSSSFFASGYRPVTSNDPPSVLPSSSYFSAVPSTDSLPTNFSALPLADRSPIVLGWKIHSSVRSALATLARLPPTRN